MSIFHVIQERMDRSERNVSDYLDRLMYGTPNPLRDPKGFVVAANEIRFIDPYEGKPPYERWATTPERRKELNRKRRIRRKGGI